MSSLAARVRTGATLAVAAAALLWAHSLLEPGVLSLVVVTVLAFFAVWELDHMGSLSGRNLGRMLYFAASVMAAALAFVLVRDLPVGAVSGLAALYVLSAVLSWPWLDPAWPARSSPTVLDGRKRLPVARQTVPLSVWLLPPLYSIVLIDRAHGTTGLVVLVVLAKAGDNAAYFVGRAIGKRHPFPRISPGKTVAGCVASLVAGIVAGAVLLPLTLGERTAGGSVLGALLGGIINVAAQAGDLSESWVKRNAGVKDSSTLLGHSGGVLDVIDSLLLAAPMALVLWAWAYPAAGR